MRNREAFQELDYRAVFGSIAKWATEIDDPARIPEIVSRAFHTACNGRPGPVVIALPACRRILDEELTELLKRSAGGLGPSPGLSLRTLVAVQIAASIALLASAGLVFRTIWALSTSDPGFNAANVIAFSFSEDLAVQRPGSGSDLVERLIEIAREGLPVMAMALFLERLKRIFIGSPWIQP